MSQSVLVQKLQMYKELVKVAKAIKERPKYMTVAGVRRLTENLPNIAEADAKFVKAAVFNSNPVMHLLFKTNTKDIITGVSIESDFQDGMKEIERSLDEAYNFEKASYYRQQFKMLEELTIIVNQKIEVSFEANGVFSSRKELEQYIDTFIPYLEECIEALQLIDFQDKKYIIRICKANLELAKVIKKNSVTFAADGFNWK